MSDAIDQGITVTEMAAMDQPIDVLRETTAAFVGRALRGPLHEPVLIHSFGEFRRRFGDIWSRSSLGPAAHQFFNHGGKRLYVVRVANNARGAMICLPAAGSALVLRALEPGSTERIRAAVDYDRIDADNDELFNLTLQRIDPANGLVLDQEFFHAASYIEGRKNFIVDLLTTSNMVRADTPLPTHRPERSSGPHVPFGSSYVEQTQEGADGHELSDYDLVGSLLHQEGLFALDKIDSFDVLYLPPPGKHRDLGPTSLLAADRYCRRRGAMLVVDPPARWQSADDAVAGVRELGLASPNMVSYFPRLRRRDDADAPLRAVGAAVAGLLCKLDRQHGAWQDMDVHGLRLDRALVPDVKFDVEQIHSMVREGLNVFVPGPADAAQLHGSVTLSRGSDSQRQFSSLPVRRSCLRILGAIEEATRWAVFEPANAQLAKRIRAQVTAYLSCLADLGAFAEEHFIVECDAGLCRKYADAEQGFAIFVAFHLVGCSAAISFTLHQSVAGCRVASTAFAPADSGMLAKSI